MVVVVVGILLGVKRTPSVVPERWRVQVVVSVTARAVRLLGKNAVTRLLLRVRQVHQVVQHGMSLPVRPSQRAMVGKVQRAAM